MKINDVRIENKVNLLRFLYREDQSRSDLSNSLGLSKSAVTQLISELEEQNLVVETGRGTSGEMGGKKPIILSVNRSAGRFLAIHLDDHHCRYGLADLRGDLLCSEAIQFTIDDDPLVTMTTIATGAQAFLRRHHPSRQLIACGVSMKGLIDSDLGILRYTSANRRWVDVPVGEILARELNCYTFVDNDARAVMCLDMFSRPDEQMDVVACVCIEDSVGTAVVIGNNVLKGAFFGATNFAHTSVDPAGPLCRCGKRGCWEALVSTGALLCAARRLPGREELTYAELVEAYRFGDPEITELLLEDYSRWIGLGIDNYLRIFNPRRLVLYVDKALFDQRLTAAVERHARANQNQVTAQSQLRFSENGPELHLRAATALAIKNFLSTTYHETLVREA